MTVAHIAVRERPVRAREHFIANRLQRFAWRHRQAVAELARRNPRLADLALSFPALLFALAVPRPRFDPEPVIERVIVGVPLRELAQAVPLPLWTRKLMPEAFLDPIPAQLPDGDLFCRQIANHRPASPKLAQPWLKAVSTTALWGHEDLAVWYGKQVGDLDRCWESRNWSLICLWAWHSRHAEAPASRLIATHWSPAISSAEAARAAEGWLTNVEAALQMGDAPVADVWGTEAVIGDLAFTPVRTADEIIAYSRELDNCARWRADSIAANVTRLWVIKRQGKPTAMLALEAGRDNPYPTIGEMSGIANARLPTDVWFAAHLWARSCVPFRPVATGSYDLPRSARWRAMWRNYWLAKGRIPTWLPLMPTHDTWCVLRTGRPRRYRRARRLRH